MTVPLVAAREEEWGSAPESVFVGPSALSVEFRGTHGNVHRALGHCEVFWYAARRNGSNSLPRLSFKIGRFLPRILSLALLA